MTRTMRMIAAAALLSSAGAATAQSRGRVDANWLVGRWNTESNCQVSRLIFRPNGTVLALTEGDGLFRMNGGQIEMKFAFAHYHMNYRALTQNEIIINGLRYVRCPGAIPPPLTDPRNSISW